MAGRNGSRRVVTAVDAFARQLGVRTGMTVTEVEAQFEGITIVLADADADDAALVRLAEWCLRISPIVAPDPPDGLIIDTAGADHLLGGEVALLKVLMDRLLEVGISSRGAIADTWGAAHALARFGRATSFIAGVNTADLLAPLPVTALRLSPTIVEQLADLGIHAIGHLLDKPTAPLARRFGPMIATRLDQALGRQYERIVPVRDLDPVVAERKFAEPIGAAETIAKYINQLAWDLCRQMHDRLIGARRVDLIARRVDNKLEAVRVLTAQPIRDPSRLSRLLCEKIEQIDPGFGIEEMQLCATEVEDLVPKQLVGELAEQDNSDIDELVDVLANRLGAENVFRASAVPGALPEKAVEQLRPDAKGSTLWRRDWPRPLRLLERPERIETMAVLPDQPPVAITYRGQRMRVRAGDGPERMFVPWLQADNRYAVRDYYRLEVDSGERLWAWRAGDGEDPRTGDMSWWLAGWFA